MIGVGGYVLNKMTGKPVGKLGGKVWNKLSGKKPTQINSGESLKQTANGSYNHSSDHHNAKSYEGQNNQSAHGNTPFDELSNYTEKYREKLGKTCYNMFLLLFIDMY
jgi:hypothetical protein